MMVYWSKEKCGDPLVIVNEHEVCRILDEELRKEYGKHYGYIMNRIRTKLMNSKVTNPFSHINEIDIQKLLER